MILFELFAYISWALALTVIGGVIAIGVFIENDEPFGATLAFFIACAIVGTAVYDWQASLAFVQTLPQYIGWAALWLVIGAIFSVFKWGFYIKRLAKQLVKNLAFVEKSWSAKAREELAANRRANGRMQDAEYAEELEREMSRRHREDLANAINNALGSVCDYRFDVKDFEKGEISIDEIFKKAKLTAGNRKALIYTWIVYWPIAMVTTAIREFMLNLLSNLFDALQGVYNYVTRMIVGDALQLAVVQANGIKQVESAAIEKINNGKVDF